jgi:hypothetical protein
MLEFLSGTSLPVLSLFFPGSGDEGEISPFFFTGGEEDGAVLLFSFSELSKTSPFFPKIGGGLGEFFSFFFLPEEGGDDGPLFLVVLGDETDSFFPDAVGETALVFLVILGIDAVSFLPDAVGVSSVTISPFLE